VRFVGQVDDVERYLQLADLFVFPSRRETFGIALIEGMACGLPCVVSSIEGVSTDIVEDGVDAILVPPGEPDEMARAVLRVWGDHDLARRLGEQARRKVCAKFSIGSVGEQHVGMYEELLFQR
jgi:glycosyltransferase involved in cell wall biosynthesis